MEKKKKPKLLLPVHISYNNSKFFKHSILIVHSTWMSKLNCQKEL